MTAAKPAEPDRPNPPGVTPNQPKDPSVYGGQWGDTGGQKPKKSPTDRPDHIETPSEGEGQGAPDSPSPTEG